MRYLEERDVQDRQDGTPPLQRLRQIPPETGRFLALLLAGAPDGAVLEVGTSAGYSTLWLSLACAQRQRQIHTFELLPEKTAVARETFALAEVEDVVQLIAGNALDHLPAYEQIGFCFLDAEKEVYEACYDLVVPRLVPGGWLVADNAHSHQAQLQPMLDKALQDEQVDALIAPIGNGLLLCRRIEG
jgi:caffeoyl-CoA O-methyltransferase